MSEAGGHAGSEGGEGGEGGEAHGGEGDEAVGGEGGETGGGEAAGEADGGEGGALEPAGSSTVAAVEQPWAPKDTEELLKVIATRDYGVSDDRSSTFATPAIKAYNDELRKANGLNSEHMVAANNAYERINENESGDKKKKKKGDKGWVSPEAAIEAYNEQVRAENAKVAPTAIKAYNGKAGIYEQVVQKKGQPLREGFTIVKVRAARMCSLS